ncbi:hypothetical protein TRFO_26526 [Tritrichomonas foetus]|uniref:Protein kinase domain-containing protein n=1 Tax=Tritrichomonas foetus TaxID=1144522 RepID=A0A1J4K379_9EUKA|nr:hypothetical protein TRFO_26526 [Tritrichomonas foetus]|eukprot:OHT05643.1 hypothetical protein TRFO_26526 [Tritrichomonas foetus]
MNLVSDLASHILNLSDFSIVRELFSNDQVKVHLVECKRTHEKFAAKTYFQNSTDFKDQVYFIREADVLMKLSHPAIVSFRGFSLTDMKNECHSVILTDFLPNGSLQNVIDNTSNYPSWNDTKKQIVILGIAAAMEYVHKKGFVHRDLKPDSVMLDENFYPVLGGFDLCTPYDPEKMMDDTVGNLIYMAPELLNDGKSSFSMDVYSFSIMLYQILGFGHPYDGETARFEIAMKVSRGERPKIPEGTTPAWANLLTKCWSENSEDRPSFTSIVEQLCTNEELIFQGIDRGEYERFKYKMLSFYSKL